ncbi:MAG: fluoride efflux transporter CrcB [Bacteroides sp.]|nr:fluoride efflux transporter CrcB [Bacteroides sp.]
MSKELLYIFLGGGTGCILRHCIQMAMHDRLVPHSFPWATFVINILGSFLIGLLYALSARFNLSAEVRLLLTTGLCGGFTTFSTFSNDGLTLLKQGLYGMFFLYALLSVALGLAAALAGGACGHHMTRL